MSHTKKTAINTFVGILCSLISSILSFVLQATFIKLLGLEYSGINGLFTDILKILNLAELGISNAILFRLYKQIAENNTNGIEKFLFFYKKLCYIIGLIILFVGLCLIPFLDFFVKETPAFPESLWSLYLIVLLTSVFTQFFNYKSTLITAKQDRYINTIINYSSLFLKHGLQILVLWLFKNIYLYLFVTLFTTILSGVVTGIISKCRYNHTFYSNEKLSKEETKDLTKDIGSLSIYKLCRTLDATIDTFLISKYISVATTAIYGSINILLNALNELLGCFNDSSMASIGDIYASGDKVKTKQVFYQSCHFTYLIYGICTATLFPFLTHFTKWWIGYTLDNTSIYIMLLNFYMYGFGMTVSTFRNSMGIFKKGWLRPAITAFINLVFSLILIQKIGLIGALLGTLISRTFTLVWYDPFIIFKNSFNESPFKFYTKYLIYGINTLFACVINLLIQDLIHLESTFIELLISGFCYFIISSIVLLLLGTFFKEQKQLINRVLILIPSLSKHKKEN